MAISSAGSGIFTSVLFKENTASKVGQSILLFKQRYYKSIIFLNVELIIVFLSTYLYTHTYFDIILFSNNLFALSLFL